MSCDGPPSKAVSHKDKRGDLSSHSLVSPILASFWQAREVSGNDMMDELSRSWPSPFVSHKQQLAKFSNELVGIFFITPERLNSSQCVFLAFFFSTPFFFWLGSRGCGTASEMQTAHNTRRHHGGWRLPKLQPIHRTCDRSQLVHSEVCPFKSVGHCGSLWFQRS